MEYNSEQIPRRYEEMQRFKEKLNDLNKAALKALGKTVLIIGAIYYIGKSFVDNPTTELEGIVFNTHYTPPTAGSFWENSKESIYSFSIDSGKTVINVNGTSDKSLEDLVAPIKQGTKVKFQVPQEKFGQNKEYTIPADKIIIE